MSGARLLGGKLTAKADYTDTVTENPTGNEWTVTGGGYTLDYTMEIKGGGSEYIQPYSCYMNGTYGTGASIKYQVRVHDHNNDFIQSTAWVRWGNTIDISHIITGSVQYGSNTTAYYIIFRVARVDDGSMSATNMVYTDCECNITYSSAPVVTQEPFTLPDDWVQNTTNTIADEFVPFETVTTPIDSDGVGDSVDEFKEFLEGVQEHETLATVFMGYVSELLRLKGITAFLCFAICCMTMIAIFELSGG